MHDNLDNIKSIIDGVLGQPKRDYAGSGGWYEYNCPSCADEKGAADDKYNLAVQIDDSHLWCHCWRCGYSGKLSRLVRDYGSQADADAYRDEMNAIKSARMFTLGGPENLDEDTTNAIDELYLPNGFKPISDEVQAKQAKSYLEGRGVGKDVTDRHKIGYTGPYCGRVSSRIVIPSYDMYDCLNYWVARDYSGNAKVKIVNPKVDKKSIVFNEGLVNWYEPITLVEGPFDHIVVPNSIPLLGKTIGQDYAVFNALKERSRSSINIMLDDDAWESAVRMYRLLNSEFGDRVRMIRCPEGYDPSDMYRDFGRKGIIGLLRSAHRLDAWTLDNVGR